MGVAAAYLQKRSMERRSKKWLGGDVQGDDPEEMTPTDAAKIAPHADEITHPHMETDIDDFAEPESEYLKEEHPDDGSLEEHAGLKPSLADELKRRRKFKL